MTKSKHRVYPKDNEEKLKEANRELRAKVKKLTKLVKKLNDEKEQLERTFGRNIAQIDRLTESLSVEETIEVANGRVLEPKTKESVIADMKQRFGGNNAKTSDKN